MPSQKQEGISHTWCNTCIACEKLSLSIKISKKQRLWLCLNSQVKKLLFRLWFVHLFMRKYISRPWNCIMGANSMLVWKLSLVLANRITGYLKKKKKKQTMGKSMAIQWLVLHAFTAGGVGSIPSWGTKIPNATRLGQTKQNIVVGILKV